MLFWSDWMAATGTSDQAINDGGKWDWVHGNDASASTTAIEVVPGGPGGLNMLRTWVRVIPNGSSGYASRWSGAGSDFAWLAAEDDVYWRFYARVHPQDNFTYANGHFVQDIHGGGELDGSQNHYWGVQHVNGDVWRSYAFSHPHGEYYSEICPFYAPTSPYAMNIGQWYRFEGHIRYLDHAKFSRTIYEMRIYDLDGNLIADTSDFSTCGGSLQDWYDSGKYWIVEGRDPTWMMGFNGPIINGPNGGTPTDGLSHDYAAFEMRNDRWVGPDPRIPVTQSQAL